ncbi:TRAP transporter substrate-binding protein [Ammoniphilus sp. CFH 90114]|uniref:TRAP transporter substrate-binding protein n=1 Tax=Ammoniphilus sp. CFH 90114 TaxID=2493665 RepID=UPI0013E98FAC|nr:TRAP transporter substrate-binding protein [Ammoniphilus sp. CFH 90114]
MKKLKSQFLLLFTSLALVLSGCGQSSTSNSSATTPGETETRTFKVAHSGGDSHVHGKAMVVFKEEVEKRSNGRIKIETYPESSLGTDGEVMRQLKSGSLDMGIIISGELANHSPSFNAWFMPFLFENASQAYEMGNTDEAKALFDTLGDAGVRSMGYLVIEMRDILSKDAVITDINQLNGVNVRVTPSPAIVDFWKSFGANPTPVDFSEVFSAFQTGVVNALDSGPTSVVNSKFHEVGKYYTETQHYAFTSAGLVSEQVWSQLSAEDQQIIQESFEAARKNNIDTYNEIAEQSVKTMQDQGVTIGKLERNAEFDATLNQFLDKYAQSDEKIKVFVEKAKEISGK